MLKKMTCLLIIIALLVTSLGCNHNKVEQASSWRKHDIREFESIFSEFVQKQHITLSAIELDAFHEITPKSVFEETGCQIFKNGRTCESYLLYDGSVYTLGIGFGGLGVVDIETCDFDGDGKKELLYTYSFGSGIHRSCFGYFNLSEKCNEEVDISAIKSLGFVQEDLILKKVSDTQMEVYTAAVAVEGGDFAKLNLKSDRLFGEIKAVKNKPVLYKK